ncbi:MAG: DUF308 domain-containing protein [Methanoregulaceae archaeon]
MESSVRVSFVPVPSWAGVIAGMILAIIGVVAFLQTEAVVRALILIAAVGLAALGILVLLGSIFLASHRATWLPFLGTGIILLVLATLFYLIPNVMLTILVFLLAVAAILAGAIMTLIGITVSSGRKTRILLTVLGLVTLFVGAYLIYEPHLSAILLVKIAGIYAVVMGILAIAGSLPSRKKPEEVDGFYYREIQD